MFENNDLRSRIGRALLASTLFLALLGHGTAWAGNDRLQKYQVDELVKILQSEGYGKISTDDNQIVFKVAGRNYVLILYPDGDLQLYYGITGITISLDDINGWNRDRRLSRAYIDAEQDPVIESDLLANAGINDEMITEFIEVFVDSTSAFRIFIQEHDSSDVPATQSGPAVSKGI